MTENIVSPKQVKRPISKLETRRGPEPAGSGSFVTHSQAMSSETKPKHCPLCDWILTDTKCWNSKCECYGKTAKMVLARRGEA